MHHIVAEAPILVLTIGDVILSPDAIGVKNLGAKLHDYTST